MAARHRIGVLTFHKCINYGSYWQARCLVEGLRARGHDAELLDHDCRQVTIAELRCAFQPKLPERSPRSDLREYAGKTRKFVDAFAGLPQSPRFSLHEPETVGSYDAIVVGSDEVWNQRHPWYGGKPIFYGAGLTTPRLVSYAASFGNQDASDGLDEWWAGHLGRFDAISVRDDNSRRMVEAATGKPPPLVLDPCLQFPPAAEAAEGEEPYAIVYGHGFPDWLSTAVAEWGRQQGVRLISIGYSNAWADEQRLSAGPEEFASLMTGAQAVITNFFHGCVFSLLNGKPFVTTTTSYRLNKVRDLAAKLGAEDRLVTSDTSRSTLAELLETPVQPHVHARIHDLRKRSDAFLDAALA